MPILQHSRLTLLRGEVERFQRGEIDLVFLKAAVALALPGDAIKSFMVGIA